MHSRSTTSFVFSRVSCPLRYIRQSSAHFHLRLVLQNHLRRWWTEFLIRIDSLKSAVFESIWTSQNTTFSRLTKGPPVIVSNDVSWQCSADIFLFPSFFPRGLLFVLFGESFVLNSSFSVDSLFPSSVECERFCCFSLSLVFSFGVNGVTPFAGEHSTEATGIGCGSGCGGFFSDRMQASKDHVVKRTKKNRQIILKDFCFSTICHAHFKSTTDQKREKERMSSPNYWKDVFREVIVQCFSLSRMWRCVFDTNMSLRFCYATADCH